MKVSILDIFWFTSTLPIILAGKKDAGPVTCGSVIKLQHKETGNNLHSHNIAWGSGSGQHSVTTNGANNDKSSLWLVKEAWGGKPVCEIGMPVKCGETIRLEHVDTGKNLHSHLFKAPLSGNQEVSGFGDTGNGDTGDNWQIVCETSDKEWMRYQPISLMHVDTKKFLSSTGNYKFNHANCGGQCPIMDQTEVSAATKKDANAKWQTGQGIYFPSRESNKRSGVDDEDEL